MNGAPSTSNALDARAPGSVATAAAALRQGRLVVFPTETVYGVGCIVTATEAVAQLRGLTKGGPPGSWHAPSTDAVLGVVAVSAPIHRRLFERLTPGPVTFVIERTEAQLSAVRGELRVEPGVIDDGHAVSVRIPDHRVASAVLEEAGVPVVARSIAAAGWGEGAALPAGGIPGVGAVLDDGPTRLGRPSTVVRLLGGGGYRVEREGALSTKAVQRAGRRTILFVCTGNTCRSPMAEAIARHELSVVTPRVEGGPAVPVEAESAGADAMEHAGATPETIKAVESLGVDAAALRRHRSRALTARMIEDADAVYAMTASHLRAARAIAGPAGAKVRLLDPDGADIPDPIGGDLGVYTRTAQRLRELIRRRLAETGGAG